MCTCANNLYSAGCHRCCSYGSKEQQKAKAELLVENEKKLQELLYCSHHDCPHNSVIASIPCVFCRNKAKGERIIELEMLIEDGLAEMILTPGYSDPGDSRKDWVARASKMLES
jgi:hypothetical protein